MKRMHCRWLARAVAAMLLAGWSAAGAATAKPHVILVMIDALRPDHIGAWGDVPAKTPNLDRIASGGVFFRNVFAPMPSSEPSRATILTGRAPHTHGVRINGRVLAPQEVALAEIFRDAGYQTVSTGPLGDGRDQGFARINLRNEGFGPDSLARLMWDTVRHDAAPAAAADSISAAIRAAVGWLAAHKDDAAPTFLWIDMPENLHEAWHPPAVYVERYDPGYTGRDVSVNKMYSPDMTAREVRHANALYDAQLEFVDGQIGRLAGALDRLGLAENTLLVVMSDHGTFMGEHALWQKPPVLFDPVMRATLMFRYPGIVPAGVQTPALVQLSDVFATVLDLAGQPVPATASDSRSLRPAFARGGTVRDAVRMEFCAYKGTVAKAVRTDRWLYVYMRSNGEILWGDGISPAEVFRRNGWGSRLLFDLNADPDRARNVVDRHRDVERTLRDQMLDWLIDTENDVPYAERGARTAR